MSLSNENNPQILAVPLGSLDADGRVFAGLHKNKRIRILSVELVNGAAIAASDSDFVQLSLEKGPVASTTVIAELDTRTAHEGAVVANIPKALNLVAAEVLVAKNLLLSVLYNETDAGTNVALTNAVLMVSYQVE